MRPARQFIVGDLISGIFDLFLTTYIRSTSIDVHSFLPSRWGRLRLFADHPLGGRGRCRVGPDGSSCKTSEGAHCAAAGCVDKKSRFAGSMPP